MSRTYRNKPRCFRYPSTFPVIRMEMAAIDCLVEAFEVAPNRLANRGNPCGAIPTAYDDLSYDTRERSKPRGRKC